MKKWEREMLADSLRSRVESLRKIYGIDLVVEIHGTHASLGFPSGWWIKNRTLRDAIFFTEGMGAGCASYLSSDIAKIKKEAEMINREFKIEKVVQGGKVKLQWHYRQEVFHAWFDCDKHGTEGYILYISKSLREKYGSKFNYVYIREVSAAIHDISDCCQKIRFA